MEEKKKPTSMTLIITFTEETKSNTDEPYIGETGRSFPPCLLQLQQSTINNMEYTMKQLSLFTLEELAECYLATKVVQKVRASLRKPSNVIKFPIKKVS